MSRFSVPIKNPFKVSSNKVLNPSSSPYASNAGMSGFDYDFTQSDEYKNALAQLQAADSPYVSELENLQGLRGSYSSSLGQRIGMLFGSNMSGNYSDFYNAFLGNLNSVLQKENARVYNTPSNQAALDKAAGLNPDLTGVSGVGAVTDVDNPVEMPSASAMASESSEIDPMQLPQMLTGIFSGTVGAVTQLAQFGLNSKLAASEIASSELSNTISREMFDVDYVSKEVGARSSLMTFIVTQAAKSLRTEDFENPIPALIKASKKVDLSGWSPAARRIGQDIIGSFDEGSLGVDSEVWKILSEIAENKHNFASRVGSSSYDSDIGTMLSLYADTYAKWNDDLASAQSRIQVAFARLRETSALVSEQTQNAQIQKVKSDASISESQAVIAGNDADVSSATKSSMIEYRKAMFEYEMAMKQYLSTTKKVINDAVNAVDNSNIPGFMKGAAKYLMVTGDGLLQSFGQAAVQGAGMYLGSGKGHSPITPTFGIGSVDYGTYNPSPSW